MTPVINDSTRLKMLEWKEGILDVVLDTDAATEVDDPFAISYLLLSPERFRVQAMYAAPFSMNDRAQDPETGMEMSYREIRNISKLCHKEGVCDIKKGSASYLTDIRLPVPSAAAADLAERAMRYSPENPLYVVGIGAGTNLASALLRKPEIAARIVVVWLAGNDFVASVVPAPAASSRPVTLRLSMASLNLSGKLPFVKKTPRPSPALAAR